MLRARSASCVNAPEMPVNATVAEPVCAVADADSVTFCAAPGASESVDGDAVTPFGKPPMVTFTGPVKPFDPVASTAIGCPDAPCVMPSLAGVIVSV